MDNFIEDLNPYRSPMGLEDVPWKNSALEECILGIVILGYAFISEYRSDKRMHELEQGDFRTNFVNNLPECFLMKACKVLSYSLVWYGL